MTEMRKKLKNKEERQPKQLKVYEKNCVLLTDWEEKEGKVGKNSAYVIRMEGSLKVFRF